MRRLLAAVLFCVVPMIAQGKPAHRAAPVTAFAGDRYAPLVYAAMAGDVVQAVRKRRAGKAKRADRGIRLAIRHPFDARAQKIAPPPMGGYFPEDFRLPDERYFDGRVTGSQAATNIPRNIPESPLGAIAARFLGGNPTGWARAWCGAFLRLVVKQAGLPDNPPGALARSWARYGKPAVPRIGAIGVMPHHVGIIIGRCSDGGVLMRSGNHNRSVGDGCYAPGRFIAFRSA